MSKETNSRNIALDTICGIMTLHMILTHICSMTGVYYLLGKFLFFFMPWFFFKGGMIHKTIPEKDMVSKSVHRLIIPFIIFSIIGYIINLFNIYYSTGQLSLSNFIILPIIQLLKVGSVSGNLPLWFLLTLFIVRIIFNYLSLHRFNPYICFTASLLGAIGLTYSGLNMPFYVLNVLTGLVFYISGHILKDIQYSRIAITIAFLGLILIAYIIPTSVDMRTNELSYGLYPIWFPYCIFGIVLLNNCAAITPPRLHIAIKLHYIGKSSMTYYVIHWPIMLFVSLMFTIFAIDYTSIGICISTIIACMILCPTFNKIVTRYFPTSLGIRHKPILEKNLAT